MNQRKLWDGKDHAVFLSAIGLELNADGKTCPSVRDLNAYYECGVFYITASKNSNKMQQIFQIKRLHFRFASKGFPEVELVLNLKNEE